MPRQFRHAVSGALCPMRARDPDRDRRQVAKLQVSGPACQQGYDPSQGGSAGSNPVGATTEDQYNTAADQQERGSAAVLCVRPGPAGSGCERVAVPYSCPRCVAVSAPACPSAASTRRRTSLVVTRAEYSPAAPFTCWRRWSTPAASRWQPAGCLLSQQVTRPAQALVTAALWRRDSPPAFGARRG